MFKLPGSIKEQIEDYGHSVGEFIDGRLSWARFSGLRVPWGNYSHRGGKIFMARVRIPAGVLTGAQLRALSLCSEKYGNGLLHITTRQDIQIHEVKIEDVMNVHRYLMDYELSSRGGGGNTVRNVLACPMAGICPEETFDVRSDAVSLTEHLLSLEDSYNMPRKFKIAFSGCAFDCVKAMVNDVGLYACERNSKPGYMVYAGGGMGAKPKVGRLLEEFIDREEAGYVVSAVKNVFYRHGNRRNKHHSRLRFLIEDIGFERFADYYREELSRLRESGDIVLRKVGLPCPEPLESEGSAGSGDGGFESFVRYNCLKQKQRGYAAVKLRIPRGDLRAVDAEKISRLEDKFEGVEFRTSTEQNLYAVNIPRSRLFEFYEETGKILSDFTYPSTLLDVVSCKGSLTCNLGLCNSPGLAREIERVVKTSFAGSKIFDKLTLKINGCPNACGQHPVGIVSLHGVVRKSGGRPVPFYRLLLGGRAGPGATRLAEDTGVLLPAKNVPSFLEEFFKQIESRFGEDAGMDEFIMREGKDIAVRVSEKYSHVPPHEENIDFYIDWGDEKEFSLEGLGAGECGSGVLDMIEADLAEAKIALEKAGIENYSPELIRKALFLSSRALLVVKGKEPKTEEEALSVFKEKFVDEGIVPEAYSEITDVYESTDESMPAEKRRERFAYAEKFLGRINELYGIMDSNFNFPASQKADEAGEKAVKTLDLKGTPCPINYVKVKLEMEEMDSGQTLEVLLDGGEPVENVPKSLEADGHRVLKIEEQDEFYKVTVRKG